MMKNMRYFIGVLLRGEVAEYYKATCADLSARFGISNVSEIVAPHLKIKSPFERPSLESVEKLLASSNMPTATPLPLANWNHFGTRTIFIDAPEITPELKTQMISFLDSLKANGVYTTPLEYDLHIHLSVARFLKPFEYTKVWEYLQTLPQPKFDITIDNLTIFSKEKDARVWKVEKTFPLKTK